MPNKMRVCYWWVSSPVSFCLTARFGDKSPPHAHAVKDSPHAKPQQVREQSWYCTDLDKWRISRRMATPFVPVPVPITRALPGSSGARRPKRASSSASSSSESSSTKGAAEDGSLGRSGHGSCFIASCQSPVTRARMNGVESSVEFSSCARPDTPSQSLGWEERPITPTVLGYEVMEERAKFTVRQMPWILLGVCQNKQFVWSVHRPYEKVTTVEVTVQGLRPQSFGDFSSEPK